ncbi:MAG: hypothetical protein AMXMBFR81_18490 [Chthonomonas sp.]
MTILDPFCGTGTTLVEAKKRGIASVGLEANPMAAFATRVKTEWGVDPNELRDWSDRAADRSRTDCERSGITATAFLEGRIAEEVSLFDLRTLDQSQFDLLLRGSISPLPLHRCLTLRHYIKEAPEQIQSYLLLALAWVAVTEAGNVRFGPEVGITPPKCDAPVFESWRSQVHRMADDLTEWRRQAGVCSRVFLADAREPNGHIEPQSIGAVFTSPPYPNEKDYTRTTRLESVLLGLLSNKSELRRLKDGLLRSNTRNVFVSDADDLYVRGNLEIQRIASDIERKRNEMGKTSGFERLYHRVAKLYFGGMARHLSEIRSYLAPGAMLGYVVGDQASYLQVLIKTGQLIASIAEDLGYEHVRTDLFRTRMATATREQLREEVVVLRWRG